MIVIQLRANQALSIASYGDTTILRAEPGARRGVTRIVIDAPPTVRVRPVRLASTALSVEPAPDAVVDNDDASPTTAGGGDCHDAGEDTIPF